MNDSIAYGDYFESVRKDTIILDATLLTSH